MATKRKIEESEVTALDLDDVYSAEDLSPVLQKMYAEMGIEGDVQASVYISQIDKDGKEYRVWQGTPDEYDLMTTARKFGSADYRVRIYVPGTRGSPVLKANRLFPIKLEAGEDARLDALRRGEVAQGAQTQQPAFTLETLTAAIKAAIPQPPPQQSNLGMLKEVAEIVRTLAPQPQAAPAFNPLDVLKIAAEFARERGGSDDPIDRGVNATGMDVFMRLVDKFAPMFAETMLKNGQPASAMLPQPQQQVEAAQPVADPANSVKTVQPENEAVIRLRMGLSFLVAQAQADNDPATYAAVVLDNVPEESIGEFLKNPAPLDYLAQFEPKVKEHAKWFNELIEAVKAELSAPDDETPQAPGVDAEHKPA